MPIKIHRAVVISMNTEILIKGDSDHGFLLKSMLSIVTFDLNIDCKVSKEQDNGYIISFASQHEAEKALINSTNLLITRMPHHYAEGIISYNKNESLIFGDAIATLTNSNVSEYKYNY